MSDLEFTVINALIQVIAYTPIWLPVVLLTWWIVWAVRGNRRARTTSTRTAADVEADAITAFNRRIGEAHRVADMATCLTLWDMPAYDHITEEDPR
jgi:hypothetical protein